jgi:hypothetical protein
MASLRWWRKRLAIHFDPKELGKNVIRQKVFLTRIEYDETRIENLLGDAVNWMEQTFTKMGGQQHGDNWTKEFALHGLNGLAFLAPCLKHPNFKDESEWRLIYRLQAGDVRRMEFRQRASLMTRHIPLVLPKPLPIVGVTVGPCRHPDLSRIAVGDLLRKHGYPESVEVRKTTIPYRMM